MQTTGVARAGKTVPFSRCPIVGDLFTVAALFTLAAEGATLEDSPRRAAQGPVRSGGNRIDERRSRSIDGLGRRVGLKTSRSGGMADALDSKDRATAASDILLNGLSKPEP